MIPAGWALLKCLELLLQLRYFFEAVLFDFVFYCQCHCHYHCYCSCAVVNVFQMAK